MKRIATAYAYGLTAWLTLLSPTGCGDADENDDPVGRGSEACQQWHRAICDHVADKCSLVSRSECIHNFFGVTCKSDQQALDCVTRLETLSCYSSPAGCDVTDMADPQPAIDACNRLFREMCQKALSCGAGGTVDECIANNTAAASLDCNHAIAVDLGFEDCLEDVNAMSCVASETPATCKDVILLDPS